MSDFEQPVEYPINGILDLHTFRPSEVSMLIPDYLELCREKGIYRVRIIHGKGKGILRRQVHAILDRLPYVSHYWKDQGCSGWGVTIVQLLPPGNSNL